MASRIQNGTSSTLPHDLPLHPSQQPIPNPPRSFLRRLWETQRSALGNIALALSCGILALRMIGMQRQLEAEMAAANQREAELEGKLSEKDEEHLKFIAWVRREAEQGGFDLGRRLLLRVGGDQSSKDKAVNTGTAKSVHQNQTTNLSEEQKGERAQPPSDLSPAGTQGGWFGWLYGSAKEESSSYVPASISNGTSTSSIINRKGAVESVAREHQAAPPQQAAGMM